MRVIWLELNGQVGDSEVMPEYSTAIVFLAAFLIDAVAGDPQYGMHPVRLAGRMIGSMERICLKAGLKKKFGGFCLTVASISAAVGLYLLLRMGLSSLNPLLTLALDTYVVYSSFALKDLFNHAIPVAEALEKEDLPAAREHVNMMVGRECSGLDRYAVARAAAESVSENFIDSFFAPVFWFGAGALLAVLPGFDSAATGVAALLVYRITNTLDAMIGYRDRHYAQFGTFAAKLDDTLTFLPARLSIIVLAPAALISGLNCKSGIKVFFNDRLKHESPNSAHAESFAAGALGLRLGGSTHYPRGVVNKPWLGNGAELAEPGHIRHACRLIASAGWITAAFAVIILCL
ncbi:MAG: adenosylcobinamide-phosphate synthase CbiB [Verrucomicrobiota bacterium]